MKKLRNILLANFIALLAVGSGLFLYKPHEIKSEPKNIPNPAESVIPSEPVLQLEGEEYKLIRYADVNDGGLPDATIENDLDNIMPPEEHLDFEKKYVWRDDTIKLNTVDEYLSYLSKYMFFDITKAEFNTSAIMDNPEDGLESFMDWPYNGEYLSYTLWELFVPGNLIIVRNEESDWYIDENDNYVDVQIMRTTIGYENISVDTAKRVVQRCKELAAGIKGSTNQEKMYNIGVLLRSIATYDKDCYEADQLLFEGKGNCNAFMRVTDIMARYLGIPCGMVGNREMNHGWDIFIGSDGQIYEIDTTPTWDNKPYPLGNLPMHKQFEEKDVELLILEYDRKLLELYGKVELPPPSATQVPPKQEEQGEQPSVQPSTEEQDKQQETEVKPEPESKLGQNDETVPPKEEATTKPDGSGLPVPEIVSITSEKEGWMTVTVSSTMSGKFNVRYKSPKDSNWMAYTTTKEEDSRLFLRSGETYTVQVRLCRYDIRNNYNYGDIYSEWSEPKEIMIK